MRLLEEPQAAFYSWLAAHRDAWRDAIEVGESILVCDVGGGTSDFSLIEVTEEDGNLDLRRAAVGNHLMLGGDNMDLALAHPDAEARAEQRFAEVRSLAEFLLFDLYDEVASVPGSLPAREMMADTGRLYLDRLRGVAGGDRDLILETALGGG